MARPRLLLTADGIPGLRSVDAVRASLSAGRSRFIWDLLLQKCEADCQNPPYTPRSALPERNPGEAEAGNCDFHIVAAAGGRIQRAALVHLLTGDSRFREDALRQLECVFDVRQWPEWRDQAHSPPADLRTGQFLRLIGLAYDWLYESLSESQRRWIVENLDRRGIQPYLQALDRKAWWAFADEPNNWMTVIVGGAGIAGMALGADHPASQRLVDEAVSRMTGYLKVIGPEGEFNESVGYAGAMRIPIEFFNIHRYWSGGRENLLQHPALRAFGDWYPYFFAPPGVNIPFGDSHRGATPFASMYATLAAANREPRFQWFYEEMGAPSLRSDFCEELLNYDPTLPAESPEGHLPHGRAFLGHGACWSSRTDWNPRKTACVVAGKGGQGTEMHGHHDIGTVCIEGYGQSLIIDLGHPPYPADFFGPERYEYYCASCFGHNVPMFGGREMRTGAHYCATILDHRFHDEVGGAWLADTSALYGGICRVRRGVIHFLPGVVAVLDVCDLKTAEETSLRWHTSEPAELQAGGRFQVVREGVALEARMVSLTSARLRMRRREHAYRPPFHLNRLGNSLEPSGETYVEGRVKTPSVRVLTLFTVLMPGCEPRPWRKTRQGWAVSTEGGMVRVSATQGRVGVTDGRRRIELDLDAGQCQIGQ